MTPKILSLVWDLMRGGTEGQCARTALHHVRLGIQHQVGVFRKRGFFLEQIETTCGPVYHVDIHHMVSKSTLREIYSLSNFIKEKQINIVHGWDMDACIFGYLASRLAGVPFISSRRNLAQAMPKYKRFLLNQIDRLAAATVVNADAIKVALPHLHSQRVWTIPNIVEQEGCPNDKPHQTIKNPSVILVCRLDPEKDVKTALEAAQLCFEAGLNWSWYIVGDGRERSSLESTFASLPDVFFTGELFEVYPLLQQASLGVLTPKANEGQSNTILEYMMAGLPFVATDNGGNRSLAENSGAGVIVPPEDPVALAQEIITLARAPDHRKEMGLLGQEYVQKNHHPERVAQQFLKLYNEVLG